MIWTSRVSLWAMILLNLCRCVFIRLSTKDWFSTNRPEQEATRHPKISRIKTFFITQRTTCFIFEREYFGKLIFFTQAMSRFFLTAVLISCSLFSFSQDLKTQRWVDSVFSKLKIEEKIGQMFMTTVSSSNTSLA